MRTRRGSILIRAGDQFIELSNRPAFIELSFGISDDRKDLMRYLDKEVPYIKKDEEELIELATEEIELDKELASFEAEEEDEEMLIDKKEVEE